MNDHQRQTIEHSASPQHPLWLSVVLSLFPGMATGVGTRRIQYGQIIMVDGGAGIVELK